MQTLFLFSGHCGRFRGMFRILTAAAAVAAASAQTFSPLYSFSGPDGGQPAAALTLGNDGNFYGTTDSGGTLSGCGGAGCGTIFRMTPSGVLTTLYSFSGPDGSSPRGLILGQDGNFYGTTPTGGASGSSCGGTGCGTVFKVTPAGALTTIYGFSGQDGALPYGSLAFASDGTLYGTTYGGGSTNYSTCAGNIGCGTVFKLTPAGALTTIYNFVGTDGSQPWAGLTLGGDGNFYGTTSFGGANTTGPCFEYGCGTVFRITPAGSLTTLYSFSGGTDGLQPSSGLTPGSDGDFYGSTEFGGGNGTGGYICSTGCGTIYKITPSGIFTSLHAFSGPDGDEPGKLTLAGNNFYGMTYADGGVNSLGTIFEVTPSGTLTSLYSLNNVLNGSAPVAALTLGPDGNLYGSTYAGGLLGASPKSPCLGQGCGTVFRWCMAGGAKGCTTTNVVSSLNPSLYGNNVMITATVLPVSGLTQPSGTVSFIAGTTLLGTVGLSNGTASLATTNLAAGQFPIAVSYSSDQNFQTSDGYLLQVVNKSSSTTTVSSSLNPSVYDQAVTLTANVKPATGSGTATGTVVFKNGSTTLGSATLSGGSASISPAPSVLAAGTLSISASYAGDANCLSSSGLLSQTVTPATTTTALAAKADPALTNQQVTFTATIAGQYSGQPTGTVTFLSNGVPLGAPAAVSARQATFNTSFASAGTYSISATYSGDSNFIGSSSAALSETIYSSTAVPTTTYLKSSGAPVYVGQPVTFTATVRPVLGSIPNGEAVTFYDGTTVIGTGITALGTAVFTTSSLAAGKHSITATYAGDGTYMASTSATAEEVVIKYTTTITISSTPNPSSYAEPITFTAVVSSNGLAPTGNVVFKNGSTAIGTGTLSGGKASFVFKWLPVGSDMITASYAGDPYSQGSSSTTLIQTVTPAATATALASGRNPSKQGESVTFTATVTCPYTTPTGTVTFTYGSTILGSAAMKGGKAFLAVSTLPVGSDTVTATYGGSPDFGMSSGSIVQTVD